MYARNAVYLGVTGWGSFEPWLSRIEAVEAERIWAIAETIPPEWYDGDVTALEQLVDSLFERRSRVREMIFAFRESSRQPFPNWGRDENSKWASLRLSKSITSVRAETRVTVAQETLPFQPR